MAYAGMISTSDTSNCMARACYEHDGVNKLNVSMTMNHECCAVQNTSYRYMFEIASRGRNYIVVGYYLLEVRVVVVVLSSSSSSSR